MLRNSSSSSLSLINLSSSNIQYVQEDITTTTLETLCCLARSLCREYRIWIPLVRKVLDKRCIISDKYKRIEEAILNNEYPEEVEIVEDELTDALSTVNYDESLRFSDVRLRNAWDTSCRYKKEDWSEWLRLFSITLLRESPVPSLRACQHVSEYSTVVRELFNASFLSCWSALNSSAQTQLVDNLKSALTAPDIPPDILQTILSLAEFMEHDDKPLPIETKLLGDIALQCRAYGKALYYKELEFRKMQAEKKQIDGDLLESIISINTLIGQHKAADGILKFAQHNLNTKLDAGLYEKLGRWQDALEAYRVRATENDPGSLIGMMHCYESLGEWEELSGLCHQVWSDDSDRKYRKFERIS